MSKVKLLEKKMIADMSLFFRVERPSDYTFEAGQYCEIILPGLENLYPKHFFSFISASQDLLGIDFLARIRDSPFKNKLMDMAIGDSMEIFEAKGLWTLENSTSRNIMFIVAGVGIAPVMSIVNSEGKNSDYKFGLLFGNRTQSTSPFYNEIYNDWPAKGLSSYFSFTEDKRLSDRTYNRKIDKEMVAEAVKLSFPQNLITEICFYICGGTEFVVETRTMLINLGVGVKDIKLDLFTGY